MPRLDAILARWDRTPPLAESLVAIAETLGVEFKRSGQPARQQEAPARADSRAREQSMRELAELLGASGAFRAETPAWLPTPTT